MRKLALALTVALLLALTACGRAITEPVCTLEHARLVATMPGDSGTAASVYQCVVPDGK